MRSSLVIAFLIVTGCTANVEIKQAPVSQRAADACDELASLCTSGGDCLPQRTFCGTDGHQFDPLFIAENTCKGGCGGVSTCLRACKLSRVNAIQSFSDTVDLNGDGVVGDGTSACSSLTSSCATSGTGCTAGEFFCVAAAPAPSPCATELTTCKASCPAHDRTCLRDCRQAYRACLAGPTPDAGMPDAGVPDAPPTTTTTYDLTYGTTSGSTGTGTIALSPAGTSCGAGCATYVAGTSVTLTATASSGSTFTSWVGCTSSTNKCTVTMTMAATVTATFTKTTTTTSYTYTTDIAPKMTGLCNGCHSGSNPPGNYLTDSYTNLFGNGSDGTPNIIAGNGNSLWVQKIAGNHKNVLGQYPGFDKVAYDWVVVNNAVK